MCKSTLLKLKSKLREESDQVFGSITLSRNARTTYK